MDSLKILNRIIEHLSPSLPVQVLRVFRFNWFERKLLFRFHDVSFSVEGNIFPSFPMLPGALTSFEKVIKLDIDIGHFYVAKWRRHIQDEKRLEMLMLFKSKMLAK